MTELLVILVVIAFILLEIICLSLIHTKSGMKTVFTCANKKTLKRILKSLK